MKKYSLLQIGIIASLLFLITSNCPAAVGDIVDWYYGHAPDHYGGLTIKKENNITYICENESETGNIYLMIPDPHTPNSLITTEVIGLDIGKDAGLSWDSDNNCWWLSGANWYYGIGQLPANGGSFIRSWIPPYVNPYGLNYHSASQKLYVGSSYKNAYIVYDMSQLTAGGEPIFDSRIDTGLGSPECLARAGDTMWIGIDYGIYKFDLNGNYQDFHFYLPDSGRGPVDLAFDGRYLWARSNKVGGTVKIYKIDIDIPTSPTPSPITSPTPVPVSPVIDSGDYDGDSTSDIAIFRGSTGLWAIRDITRVYFGSRGDVPAPGDFDGDGDTDIALFRGSSGLWAARGVTRFYFGAENDLPVPGDYDGDGICNAGIFRSATGLWAARNITRVYFGKEGDIPVPAYGDREAKYMGIFRSSTGLWALRELTRSYFGATGDIPVPDNYQGTSGTLDLGIYRPGSGLWAIKGISRVYFGGLDDLPVPGYYRGMDTAEMSIFRPSSGLWAIRGLTRAYYGTKGDIPLGGRAAEYTYDSLILDSGDYNGDGTGDVAIFRPDTGLWAIKGITRVYFGKRRDIPVPGDYNGDGTTDIAVYDNSRRLWSIKDVTRIYFSSKLSGKPVPGDYTGDGACDPALFDDGLWSIRVQYPEPYILQIRYGQTDDQPVPGRYSGKNFKEIAIFRPTTGLWAINDLTRIYFGVGADRGLPADYNGDGTTDLAVYRPDEKLWAIRNITRFNFTGSGEIIPVPFDFQGDGTADIARFNNALGLWSIRSYTKIFFGNPGDLPVSGPEISEKQEGKAIPSFMNPVCSPASCSQGQ